MKNLHVSEKFYSLQGEGQTTGTPAVFLRLSGCNLLCTWCDTIEVWKKGVKTPYNEVLTGELFERLNNGAHLVITGGEPLLHQKAIIDFLKWFRGVYGWLPTIEIETNGTIKPLSDLKAMVTFWNVSPKLANSGEPLNDRCVEDALAHIEQLDNVIYKFVISRESDYIEMLQDYDMIDMSRVWLMPCGENQEQLSANRLMVAELAREQGHYYSDRLHVVIWNEKTGV